MASHSRCPIGTHMTAGTSTVAAVERTSAAVLLLCLTLRNGTLRGREVDLLNEGQFCETD